MMARSSVDVRVIALVAAGLLLLWLTFGSENRAEPVKPLDVEQQLVEDGASRGRPQLDLSQVKLELQKPKEEAKPLRKEIVHHDPEDVDEFTVLFQTTKGDITIRVKRAWSPRGADQFRELVESGFYEASTTKGISFFRVVPNFVAQFGIHGDPKISSVWREKVIDDDEVILSNEKGTLTYATSGKNTRTSQLFFNLVDNRSLDRMGFSPFGKVVSGLSTLMAINKEYGERPNQGMIQQQGEGYLAPNFPNLDYITHAAVISEKYLSE